MGWTHNTYGGGEVQRGFWWENLRERNEEMKKYPGVDGRIILKIHLQEVGGMGHGLDCYDSEKGRVVISYGCSNEPLRSIK